MKMGKSIEKKETVIREQDTPKNVKYYSFVVVSEAAAMQCYVISIAWHLERSDRTATFSKIITSTSEG